MIKLTFTFQREVISFEIENKVVKYFDKNWRQGIMIMPMADPKVKLFVKKMIYSRKSSVSATGLLIADANLGKNKEEYDKCQTDEEIAELIRKDAKLKGLLEAK